ncbi:MAG TPA: NosD domain-containing protein, partial [Gemmatimonadales bacterium]|nr:NosD domain-containing protein [Gemmatimonadales bacterium]
MMPISAATLAPLVALLAASEAGAPCLRPNRAGTQVQGEVRVCPGRYRIADPGERGVIIAAASGTRIDLSGVVIESGDSVPGRFVGVGVASRDVDGVSILGGTLRGYRYGIRLEGGKGHRITGGDVSGNRSEAFRSTSEAADTADRLELAKPEVFLAYGGGVLLLRTSGVSVTGVSARGATTGIGLVDTRESYVADNDASGNTAWGIHLFRSARNLVARNRADHTVRCIPPTDCHAAGILLREASDSNTITDNDLTASSTGLLVTGRAPIARASVGNLAFRNTASGAAGAGFAIGYVWNITLLENRADSSEQGIRLDHVTAAVVRGNTVIGAREAAIAAEYGRDNAIEANALVDAPIGIRIGAPGARGNRSVGYRLDDNIIGGAEKGIVLQATTGSRVRGNVFDGVGDGLTVDGV